jgi:hypothetical protein
VVRIRIERAFRALTDALAPAGSVDSYDRTVRFKVSLEGLAPTAVSSGEAAELEAVLRDLRGRVIPGRPRAIKSWKKLVKSSERPGRRGDRARVFLARLGEDRKREIEESLPRFWSAEMWAEAPNSDTARGIGVDRMEQALSDTGRTAWFVEYAEVVTWRFLGFSVGDGVSVPPRGGTWWRG